MHRSWRGGVRPPRPRAKKANLIPRTSRKEAAALDAIIFVKALKSAALFVIGLALFALVTRDLGALAHRVAEAMSLDVHRVYVEHAIEQLGSLTLRQKAAGGGGAIVYGAILAIEAVGLARRRAWAAWLSVVVGSALLPVEAYELFHRPSLRLLAAFVLNAAVVVYLTIEARRARPGPKRRPFRAEWFATHWHAARGHHEAPAGG